MNKHYEHHHLIFVAVAMLLSPLTVFAAQIDWGAVQATTASAANDVADGGNIVLAINGHSQADSSSIVAPATVTLDGIVFESTPITDFLGRTALDVPNALSSPNSTGDADYDAFLTHVAFVRTSVSGLAGTNTNAIYPIAGLTTNSDYLVQLWYTDERPGTAGRVARYGDNEAIENAVNVPGAGANGFGNFVVGTFTADSVTQDLRLAINDGNASHLTGILVREVVPEPTSMAMLVSGLLLLVGFRRQFRDRRELR